MFWFHFISLERNVKWTLLLETSSNTWHQKEHLRDTTPRYCNLLYWMSGRGGGGGCSLISANCGSLCVLCGYVCVRSVCTSPHTSFDFLSMAALFFHPLTVIQDNQCFLFYYQAPFTLLLRNLSGAFRKRSSNQRNLKTPALRFSAGQKTFSRRRFSKTMTSRQSRDFPAWVFLEYKMTGDHYKWIYASSCSIWTAENDMKIWLIIAVIHTTSISSCEIKGINFAALFTGDFCIFKFLRRSVDGKHMMHFQSENTVFKFLKRNLDGAPVQLI